MKKQISLEKRRRICGFIFVTPWIIGFLLFMIYPLFTSFYLSVGKLENLVGLKTEFIGFDNYKELFTTDISFLPAFWDTATETFLWTPFIIVFSLFVAILLNRNIKFKGVFRVIYFLPVLLGSGFVMERLGAGAAEKFMVLPESWLNFISFYVNTEVAVFLEGISKDLLSIFWRSGVQIVIFLAGLQGIPAIYHEAAEIEGASSWTYLFLVVLPTLSPIILLNTIYTVVDGFRNSDNEIADLIISVGFEQSNYEYGAAMGWVYFVLVMLLIGVILLLWGRLFRNEK